jgi:hypothetical protein
MLRYEVESLDGVDEAHRGYYAPTESGAFRLQISGYESAAELRESKARESEGRKAAEAKIRELEATQSDRQYAFAQEQAASAKALAKIPEALRAPVYGSPEYRAALAAYDAEHSAPYIAKLSEAATASKQAEIASLRADLETATLDRVSHELSVKLAHPEYRALLLPHIRERLEARDENGAVVISAKGAASLDDLAEQMRAAPEFSRIIIGASPAEKARHAARVAETLGEPAARQPLTRAKFEALSPEKRAEHARAGTTILDG